MQTSPDPALRLLDHYALTTVENAYYHYYNPPQKGRKRSKSASRRHHDAKKASSGAVQGTSTHIRERIARHVIVHILKSVRETLERRVHGSSAPLRLLDMASDKQNVPSYPPHSVSNSSDALVAEHEKEEKKSTPVTEEDLTSQDLLTAVVSRLRRLEEPATRGKKHTHEDDQNYRQQYQPYWEEYERLPRLPKIWCETLLQELLLQVLKTIENRIPDIFRKESSGVGETGENANGSHERKRFRAILKVIVFDCQHQILKDRNKLAKHISQYSKCRSRVLVRLIRYMAEDVVDEGETSFPYSAKEATPSDSKHYHHSHSLFASPLKTVSDICEDTSPWLRYGEHWNERIHERNVVGEGYANPNHEPSHGAGAYDDPSESNSLASQVPPERLAMTINKSLCSPLALQPVTRHQNVTSCLTAQHTVSFEVPQSRDLRHLAVSSSLTQQSVHGSNARSCCRQRDTVKDEIREGSGIETKLASARRMLNNFLGYHTSLQRELLLTRAFYQWRNRCGNKTRLLPSVTKCSKSIVEEVKCSEGGGPQASQLLVQRERSLLYKCGERCGRLRYSTLMDRYFMRWKLYIRYGRKPDLIIAAPFNDQVEPVLKSKSERQVIPRQTLSHARTSLASIRAGFRELRELMGGFNLQIPEMPRLVYQSLGPLITHYRFYCDSTSHLRRQLHAARFQLDCTARRGALRARLLYQSYRSRLRALQQRLQYVEHKKLKSKRRAAVRNAVNKMLPWIQRMHNESQRTQSRHCRLSQAMKKIATDVYGLILQAQTELHDTFISIERKMENLMERLGNIECCKARLQTSLCHFRQCHLPRSSLKITHRDVTQIADIARSITQPLAVCFEEASLDIDRLRSYTDSLKRSLPRPGNLRKTNPAVDVCIREQVCHVSDRFAVRREAKLVQYLVGYLRGEYEEIRNACRTDVESIVDFISFHRCSLSRRPLQSAQPASLSAASRLNEMSVNRDSPLVPTTEARRVKTEFCRLSSSHKEVADAIAERFQRTLLDFDLMQSSILKTLTSFDLDKPTHTNASSTSQELSSVDDSQVAAAQPRISIITNAKILRDRSVGLSSEFRDISASITAQWSHELSELERTKDTVMGAVRSQSASVNYTSQCLRLLEDENRELRDDYEHLESRFVHIARCVASLVSSVKSFAESLDQSLHRHKQSVFHQMAAQNKKLKRMLYNHRAVLDGGNAKYANSIDYDEHRGALKAVERIWKERMSMMREDTRSLVSELKHRHAGDINEHLGRLTEDKNAQALDMQREFQRRLREKEAECKREILAYQRESIDSFRNYRRRFGILTQNRIGMVFEDMRSQHLNRVYSRNCLASLEGRKRYSLLSELDELLHVVDDYKSSDAETLRRLEYQLSQNDLTINIMGATERPPGHTRKALSQIGNLLNGRSLTYQPFDREETDEIRPASTSTADTRELEDLSEGDIEEAMNMIGELSRKDGDWDGSFGESKDENRNVLDQSHLSSEEDDKQLKTPAHKFRENQQNVGDSLTKHPSRVMETPYDGPPSKTNQGYYHKHGGNLHLGDNLRKRILHLRSMVSSSPIVDDRSDEHQLVYETTPRGRLDTRFCGDKEPLTSAKVTGYSKDPLTPTTWEDSLGSPPPTRAQENSTKAKHQFSQGPSQSPDVRRSVESFYTI
eukprot:gb/GECG01008438.1/.p1 GENE.gb/GECG01008438.1/~~gb/GECG01008438.1/.p1  ORF type:complete len:1651 (+),score=185.13 gb/GECG01008438.1/:1-4953(+)